MTRFLVTIDHTKVAGSLAGFPVYIDLADMPVVFWNDVRDGGADIRAYASDGTELARDVVRCDTSSRAGELHVKADISGSADTHIFIDVDGERIDYEPADPYGSEAVWSSYTSVFHLGESAGPYYDSVGDSGGPMGTGLPSRSDAMLGGGQSLAATQYIEGPVTYFPSGDFTMSLWINIASAKNYANIFSIGTGIANHGLEYVLIGSLHTDRLVFSVNDSAGGSRLVHSASLGSISGLSGAWRHFVGVREGDTLKAYTDGVLVDAYELAPNYTMTEASQPLIIGGFERNTTGNLVAVADEPRYMDGAALSAEWIAAEYANQSNPSAFYSVRPPPLGLFITIDHTKVSQSLVGFPVYVDLADMPSSFWDTVRDGGGDIRAYTYSGSDELARDVVRCDTANAIGEMHIKADISSDVDTVIALDVDGQRLDYAASDPYGSQATWASGYAAVWHMGQDPSTAPPQIPNSANDTHPLSARGTMPSSSLVNAKLGKGISLDGSNNFSLSTLHVSQTGNASYSLWVKLTGDNANNYLGAGLGTSWQRFAIFRNNRVGSRFGEYIHDTTDLNDGNWHHLYFVDDKPSGRTRRVYLNGEKVIDEAITAGGIYGSDAINLGEVASYNSGLSILGVIDEVRVSSLSRSDDWIATEYANQHSPQGFYEVSEPIVQVLGCVDRNQLAPPMMLGRIQQLSPMTASRTMVGLPVAMGGWRTQIPTPIALARNKKSMPLAAGRTIDDLPIAAGRSEEPLPIAAGRIKKEWSGCDE